jgi:hypothetical protein
MNGNAISNLNKLNIEALMEVNAILNTILLNDQKNVTLMRIK